MGTKRLEQKRCPYCNETFQPRLSQSTYCSNKCYWKSKKGVSHPATNGSLVTLICPGCNKSFCIGAHLARVGRRYCTKACADAHMWTPEVRLQIASRSRRVRRAQHRRPSKPETAVADWLRQRGVPFVQQAPLGRMAVVDFQIGNAFVEVQGCYWHGCPKHFPIPTTVQKKRITHDRGIATYCRRRKIPLITIWEHDIKKDDFSSLVPLLGTNQTQLALFSLVSPPESVKARSTVHVRRGEGQHRHVLTENQVRVIRHRAAGGERQDVLAEEFGVHYATISDVVHRRTWKHVA